MARAESRGNVFWEMRKMPSICMSPEVLQMTLEIEGSASYFANHAEFNLVADPAVE